MVSAVPWYVTITPKPPLSCQCMKTTALQLQLLSRRHWLVATLLLQLYGRTPYRQRLLQQHSTVRPVAAALTEPSLQQVAGGMSGQRRNAHEIPRLPSHLMDTTLCSMPTPPSGPSVHKSHHHTTLQECAALPAPPHGSCVQALALPHLPGICQPHPVRPPPTAARCLRGTCL